MRHKQGAALLRRHAHFDVTASLTQGLAYHLDNGFATDMPPRLERPRIELGAAQWVRLAVDAIETPQRHSITWAA
jgi:hypothetical protein